MSPFNPNIPMANDILSDSQVDLLDNNGDLDTSFGMDHYMFSDLTANNGFHKVVHTPSQASSPSTHPATTTNPIFYAAVDNVNLPILQYSRGPSDAVQGPITTLQSSATGITITTNGTASILDFNAMSPAVPYCYGTLTYAFNASAGPAGPFVGSFLFFWNGSAGKVSSIVTAQSVFAQFSGSILQLVNPGPTATALAWTLQFSRIFTPL